MSDSEWKAFVNGKESYLIAMGDTGHVVTATIMSSVTLLDGFNASETSSSSLITSHHDSIELDHQSSSSSSSCPSSHHAGCVNGLILTAWEPVNDIDDLTRSYRAIVYLVALAYMIYGVNIITDRLVSTIEVIISVKRRVPVKAANGTIKYVKVPIWHPVVATLTVYVIGASAPEIFLPVIEVVKHHFGSDELGPSLIVGSGAYHLFLITGLCVGSVKETVSKPIEDLGVFFTTTAFAILAYLWLFLLVEQISPGIIELWEAIVTLAMFPAIVVVAWAVEKRLLLHLFRRLRRNFCSSSTSPVRADSITEPDNDAMVENERRRKLGELLKELKAAHPEKTKFELEEMAQLKMLEAAPKGAAFYRMQAAKASSGGGAVISKDKIKKRLQQEQQIKEASTHLLVDPNAQLIGFTEAKHTCIESCGYVVLSVERSGAGVNETELTVEYETIEGSAKAVSDYEHVAGRLLFAVGQKTADVMVRIIDDDEFEEDKDFVIRLYNARLTFKKSYQPPLQQYNARLVISEASVYILDDDHCGSFHFETAELAIPDNIGTARIKVVRSTGARGCVALPFRVNSGTALQNTDYLVPHSQQIVFENNQAESFIPIEIIDTNRVGELHTFYVELLPPKVVSQPPANPLGNPVLGSPSLIRLGICEDIELSEALDRLLKVGDMAELISSTTWADQFREAVHLSLQRDEADDEVESESSAGDDVEQPRRSASINSAKRCAQTRTTVCMMRRLVIYIISLPWKLLAAALPPAHFLHGWVAFILLLVVMAVIAAVIGDLATHFGCTVGVKDSVTAVTLIAFGMGLPDTFASRHAAIHEKTADAAIGHITGSNAVNVFLGIGLAWTVAAGYKTYNGMQYEVPAGNFGFIVTVYCGFASVGVFTLLLRRLPPIKGELGGPKVPKIISASLFILLWIAFIVLSTLRSYCVIPGF